LYLVKTPAALKPFAADLVWNVKTKDKIIYLTFDDGPSACCTEEILNVLTKYDAKATFFCIGGNVAKHPELYARLISGGHRAGNHTWNHMSGWEFSDYSYLRNILECAAVVESNLFRPPYGKISRSQAQSIGKRFSIIMWDVLSADWDPAVSPEKCLSNVVNNSTAGSIVVFHDSEKAHKNMSYALPRALEIWSEQGYRFEALPAKIIK
jgi:peptidoglycan/xylan/chitin deacetylase (PgdA/CDA1 family)